MEPTSLLTLPISSTGTHFRSIKGTSAERMLPSKGSIWRANLRIPNRTTTIIISGVGLGIVVFGILLRRWFQRGRITGPKLTSRFHDGSVQDGSCDVPPRVERPESVRASSRLRCTPSFSDRGSGRQGNSRQRNHFSNSMEAFPPVCSDSSHELLRALERAINVIEFYREKDGSKTEELTSIADRLHGLEADISRLVADGALDEYRDDFSNVVAQGWQGYSAPRAGTLSVLSDDSFMSAYEEFAVTLDDDVSRDISVPEDQLLFYKEGLKAANNGEVDYRKMRGDICQCDSELDFAAKLWCLRQAFAVCLNDDHRQVWLAKAGRTLLGDILRHSKQDPTQFYIAFDALIDFFRIESNISQMAEELADRGVVECGFWDVVLDFILLDSFDDIKSPPSAVYSVTKNYFLSNSMKYSTISTIIWSMLKAKRQRLKDPNGFIAHIYNVSEAVSPAITLGFLGTDPRIGELCQYFKEQITQFVVDIFNPKRVRYTTVDALAEDVWIILETRTEAVRTRLGTELIPA
ncbi:unnamed protein product [Cylicocyclus nassatus]|uniref:Mitoguardin n=1 Tax=Cylicocyclus nassatus TaxID=53992 RepID=A0AA36HHD8_CYLNA|nr:unnamed protein product [Cylicocyclus nassatus]